MIQINNVSKKYGNSFVLNSIQLNISKGETVAIIGESGSGKSTLIKTINGLVELTSGTVFVDGYDITTMEHTSLTKKIGMVFQDFGLFANKTVLENLVTPQAVVHKVPRDKAIETARAQLNEVRMLAHADKYPSQLSGGQQQRVGIARALVMNPDCILMDEPTSALDPETISEVLDIMANLAKRGITLIVVTHEMGFARHVADRVVFMAEGRIVEVAKSEDFFDCPKSERAQNFLSKVIR